MRRALRVAGAALCLATGLVGCAPTPPAVVEAEGVVLLNGEPLPNAQIQFVPDLKHFGAKYNSQAISDAQGRFQLKCSNKGEAGAAVANHWVVVTDAPMPKELRGVDGAAQEKAAEWLESQTNRPIPTEYGSVGTTPLKVEVTKDKKSYELKLVRKS
ncbi:MAG TPA: hypothetical protein VFE62_06615 [Gemmataceae bacterium]|nr:hypothetical protein [Gemmataceae bacterium]